MINPKITSSPYLSYWNPDEYPYYITSIQSINIFRNDQHKSPVIMDGDDKLLFVINGHADIDFSNYKSSKSLTFNIEKNDVFFCPGGTTYNIVNTSPNFEFLWIKFTLYTSVNLISQEHIFSVINILNQSNVHHRVFIALENLTRIEVGDDSYNQLLQIMNEYRTQIPGYSPIIQCCLTKLIFLLLRQHSQNFESILYNVDHLGLSTKYSSNTLMPKNCKLTISDVEILENDPTLPKSKTALLTRFLTKRFCVLPDYTENIDSICSEDPNTKSMQLEITALNETQYHIWLYPDEENFTSDLRPYKETGYIRFQAKCNMEIFFGMVIYNHKKHECINHVFHILPGDEFTEFSTPLIKGTKDNKFSQYVYNIIDYISANYQNKISLEDIAKKVHLNSSYMSTMFKLHVGTSITDYIMNCRLSAAQNLLANSTELSISEIALETGFYDAAHFSKAFKKAFGITAHEYKQNSTSK